MPTEENVQQTHALMASVAAHMGPEWSYTLTHYPDGRVTDSAAIRHQDGYAVTGMLGRWHKRGRLCIDGDYPKTKKGEIVGPHQLRYNDARPAITVAADRPAAAIAREIHRRFLPAYVPIWQECRERAGQADAYDAAKQGTRERLAALPGVRFFNEEQADFKLNVPADGGYTPRADLRVSSGDYVECKLTSLTGDQAMRLVRFLLSEGLNADEVKGEE